MGALTGGCCSAGKRVVVAAWCWRSAARNGAILLLGCAATVWFQSIHVLDWTILNLFIWSAVIPLLKSVLQRTRKSEKVVIYNTDLILRITRNHFGSK